jgi:hypothetical protein
VITCPRCDRLKSEEKFSRDKNRANGRHPWCKSCQMEGNRRPQRGQPTGNSCTVCDRVLLGSLNRRYCSTKCKDRAANQAKRVG